MSLSCAAGEQVDHLGHCLDQCVRVGVAHGLDQARRGRRDPGSVAEGPGGQADGQLAPSCPGDGQRLREHVRQVRDTGDGAVVLGGLGGHDDGPAGQGHLGNLPPHLGIAVLLRADHPHRVAEQLGERRRPAGFRRPGHRMPTHVPCAQTAGGDRVEDGLLHADHVGERVVRGVFGDRGEYVVDGGHRHRNDDQRVGGGGALQDGGEFGVGVEAVFGGRGDSGG